MYDGLTVSDNGTGFSNIHMVYDTKKSGILIVNGMVEELEGSLEVKNNGGACVEIIFRLK